MLVQYEVVIKPVRKNMLKTLGAKEAELLKRHMAYFQGLQAFKNAEIKYSKKSNYVKKLVFTSGSKAEMEFLMLVDPAVQAGLLKTEIKEVSSPYKNTAVLSYSYAAS